MDSSVSPKDEIWFLRVCHHISKRNLPVLTFKTLEFRLPYLPGCFQSHLRECFNFRSCNFTMNINRKSVKYYQGMNFVELTLAENLIFVVPSIMLYSSEISPTRCNISVFILRNGFTLHVSGDNLTHHQEYICCIWPQVSWLT